MPYTNIRSAVMFKSVKSHSIVYGISGYISRNYSFKNLVKNANIYSTLERKKSGMMCEWKYLKTCKNVKKG